MFDDISNERKQQIEEAAKRSREIVLNMSYVKSSYFLSTPIIISEFLVKSEYVCRKYLKFNLKQNEKNLFLIYNILPDDNEFMNILRKSKYDKKIYSKKHGIPESVIRIRYKYILEKRKKELTKENNEFKKTIS